MSEIIGVKVCSLGLHRLFKDRFERVDGDIWRILGDRQPVIGNDGTDVPLLEEGFITITPVSVLRTDTSALIKCKNWKNENCCNWGRSFGELCPQ